MIKVNVEINKKSWVKKIKNPKEYFHYKLKKISNNIILFKKKSFVFTILLTNSLQIRKLNQKFRKKNKPTDVLSFPFFSTKDLKNFKKGKIYLGDLAICYEIINKRSKKTNFSIEFDKMWVHGFLHLLGYNHIKNKDCFKMQKIENKIINLISKK